MKVGLIDVDGHNYPNLPLMKLSAFHKSQGDEVGWYDPWEGLLEPYDQVYMSKVFSFTPDYDKPIYASEISGGVQDTVSTYRMAKRSLTKARTGICRMRLSISILTTRYIRALRMKRHMASSQGDAQGGATSATLLPKKADAVTRWLTSMSFGKGRRTSCFVTRTSLLAEIIETYFSNLSIVRRESSSTKGWMCV